MRLTSVPTECRYKQRPQRHHAAGRLHLGTISMASRGPIGNGRFCSAIACSNCDRRCPGMPFFKFPKDKERYVATLTT